MIFPLKTSRWSRFLSSSSGPFEVEVTDEVVSVRMGWVGHVDVPIASIASIRSQKWPWWAGVGARITKGMVVFAPSPGQGVVIELLDKITAHMPAPWETSRVLVVAENPAAFAEAVAARRAAAGA
ncbi:MAG: hypothetical protein KGQ95_08260 [Acidobacteria bacterium]|nr:hypothetical protein [Acidobacteriota bacterium]